MEHSITTDVFNGHDDSKTHLSKNPLGDGQSFKIRSRDVNSFPRRKALV